MAAQQGHEDLRYLGTVPVSKLVSGECLTMRDDASAVAAIRELDSQDRGALAVEDDVGRIIGIFTERDVLLLSLCGDEDWKDRPLARVMTKNPVVVHEGESVASALRKMKQGHFRHLPVVDDDGRPVAMISIRQVIADVAEHFPAEVQNLPPDPSRESRDLYGG